MVELDSASNVLLLPQHLVVPNSRRSHAHRTWKCRLGICGERYLWGRTRSMRSGVRLRGLLRIPQRRLVRLTRSL